MKYRMMKVFDCQDMPEDLRKEFFALWDDRGNDTFVKWGIAESIYESDDDINKRIDDWLVENGADAAPGDDDSGECVLISYWW